MIDRFCNRNGEMKAFNRGFELNFFNQDLSN